jgi:hypothetical protein
VISETLVLQNKRSDYLFVDETPEGVHFILVDKKGHIIRAADLPITIEVFTKSMHKAGYKHVDFSSLRMSVQNNYGNTSPNYRTKDYYSIIKETEPS